MANTDLRSRLRRIVEPASKKPVKPDLNEAVAAESGFSPVEVTDSVKDQKLEGVRALVQLHEEQDKRLRERGQETRRAGYHVTGWGN